MASTIKRHMLSIFPAQMGGLTNFGKVSEFTEADSQSFVYGAPLEFDASEEDVRLAVDSDQKGVGIALEAASGTGGTAISVLLFNPGQIFRVPVLNAGAAAAADKAHIGKNYSFVARSDGYGYGLDTADTGSNDWFRVIGLDPRVSDGDNPGYYLVTVLPAIYDIFQGT